METEYGSSNVDTLILVQENVFNPKMVSPEAHITGLLGRKTLLQVRQKDPSLGTGIRVLEALKHRAEGTVCGVAGMLTLLQKLLHRTIDDAVRSHRRRRSPKAQRKESQKKSNTLHSTVDKSRRKRQDGRERVTLKTYI